MLQGCSYEVQEIKKSIGTFTLVKENYKNSFSIVKLDPDIVRVKFLVNQFDRETFGSRQFKINFDKKGSVHLSGGDMLELTDTKSELNLFFEPF